MSPQKFNKNICKSEFENFERSVEERAVKMLSQRARGCESRAASSPRRGLVPHERPRRLGVFPGLRESARNFEVLLLVATCWRARSR